MKWLKDLLMRKFGIQSEAERRAAAYRRISEWSVAPDRERDEASRRNMR